MRLVLAAALLALGMSANIQGLRTPNARFLEEAEAVVEVNPQSPNEKLMNCLGMHPPRQFDECLRGQNTLELEGDDRRLNDNQDVVTQPAEHMSDSTQYVDPCASLPADPEADGWIRIPDNDDKSSPIVSLNFDFTLYGIFYPKNQPWMYVNNNGNLSFNSSIAAYTANGFPLDDVAMVAPFWSDVDTRGPGNGRVYYKEIASNTFSAVWDRVGYYNENTDKRNTFQVVISDGTNPKFNGLGNNVCFCYGDMDWATGSASGGVEGFNGVPATVGINSGVDSNYVQMGRFGIPGNSYDGPGNKTDGVDWLDYQGYIPKNGAVRTTSAVCFDARSENVAPVVTGFPANDKAEGTVCGNIALEFDLSFATPEMNQFISVTLPTNLPEGMSLESINTGNGGSVEVKISWTPVKGQEGTYELKFVAQDNKEGDDFFVPIVVEKTLTLEIFGGSCGAENPTDLPEFCVALEGAECDVEPKPFCTPYRSPDHCPASSSFPLLIGDRDKLVQAYLEDAQDGGTNDLDGYWFQYLEDKGAGYAFTRGEGYATPEIYCCIDDIDQIEVCYSNSTSLTEGAPSTNFVIRASGLHSTMGIYVMPEGFGGIELISKRVMSLEDIKTEVKSIYPDAQKFIVEEFISGGAVGEPAKLPTEYKFHMFNGKFGSVSAFYNRGTDCACYLEVDAEWKRLDKYGCFIPGMPMGKNDDGDKCYDIDFETGALNPSTLKGFDLCGIVDRPDVCVWSSLIEQATNLSTQIGVYMRIDFFVTDDHRIYVQEYTGKHNGGLRHCAAQMKDDGCIDSCFLGEMWKNAGGNSLYGGPVLPIPESLRSYSTITAEDQCNIVRSSVANGAPVASQTCV